MASELLPGYYVEASTGAWLTLPPFPLGASKVPTLVGELLGLDYIPETIGMDVVEWCEAHMRDLRSDNFWRFTRGQINRLLWWYALDRTSTPEAPHWLYRSGAVRGAKGTGKDPNLAIMANAEMSGPTLPYWDEGRWIGIPHRLSLVQIGANSEGQARDPMRVANALWDIDYRTEMGLDPGITRSQMPNGSRLEILTTSAASTEGDPATAGFLNESHWMTEANGGQGLAGVTRRNVAKSPGGLARVLEWTNTHMPGEGSVAEETFEAWQAQASGRTRRRDIMYDSREAPPHLSIYDEAQLMEGLRAAYGDAPWVDLDRIRDEAQDPRVPLADSIRFYFSSLPTSEDAWVDPRAFDALNTAEPLEDGQPVALFITLSKTENATALAACRISDGAVFGLGCWERPKGAIEWSVPREDVDAEVMAAKERFDVQWLGVNPSAAREDDTEQAYWAALIDHWHREFRSSLLLHTVSTSTSTGAKPSSVLFDLRLHKIGGRERLREFTEVAEQTVEDIEQAGTFRWGSNAILRLHVHNARRRPNGFGVSLGKRSRESSKLVDYAVAMVGARMGRRRILNSGKERTKRTGRVMSV